MIRLMQSTAFLAILFISSAISAQEGFWLTNLENREQLNHIRQLKNGNYLVSGRTFEVGAKADLIILLDSNGNEIARKSLCEVCSSAEVVYTNQNSLGELIHYFSNGDVYRSTPDLSESEWIFNIKEGLFETVDVYDYWENGNWVVLTSTSVQNGVRGILYSMMDATEPGVLVRIFNSNAPDITGSIGIGRFGDSSFIDGFNVLDDNGDIIGQLDKRDARGELIWTQEVARGNLELTHAIATYTFDIFVTGVIEDEEDASHTQGIVIKYDEDGNELWRRRYDSPFNDDRSYEESFLRINRIEKIDANRLLLVADVGGVSRTGRVSESMLLHMDPDGNITEEFRFSSITDINNAVDMAWNTQGQPVLLANAFNGNSAAGSYLTIGRRPTSVVETLPESIEVFPNPVTNILMINSDDEDLADSIFSIYSADGQFVSEQPGNDRLDVSALDSGIYQLVIATENGNYRTTFVKSSK